MKELPWQVGSSMRDFLSPEVFAAPLEALALGKKGCEDTTWLIHMENSHYFITRVNRGGIVASVEKYDTHPLQVEGSKQHPLTFKIHRDATALIPMKSQIIDWIKGLCDQHPNEMVPPEFAVGDVVFTADTKIILNTTNSQWSHAGVYIGNETVAEAMAPIGDRLKVASRLGPRNGVYYTPLSAFSGKRKLAVLRHPFWDLLSQADFEEKSALGWNMPYSIREAIRSAICKMLGVAKKPAGIFCSQYVLEVYYRLGLEALSHDKRDPYSVHPGELFNLLKSIGFTEVIMR